MDIKWAGDSVVIVRAINTLSGYRFEKGRFVQYFQIELSEKGDIEPADISVSPDGKWLALARPQSISLIDLGDGSVALERDFRFKEESMAVTAIAFSPRGVPGFVTPNDPKANLVFATSNGEKSTLLVTDLFDTTPPKGENSCGRRLCGLTGTSKVVGINPAQAPLPGRLGSIFPLSSFARLEAGRVAFEGLIQDTECSKATFISAANGNPNKNIDSIDILLPCRRYSYPLGQYSISILASRPFAYPLTDRPSFEPVKKGKEMLIAIGTSTTCEGIKIDRISVTSKGWASKMKECIKGQFVGREMTSVQFSGSGRFIAYGGADTEFGVLTYPEKKNVQVD